MKNKIFRNYNIFVLLSLSGFFGAISGCHSSKELINDFNYFEKHSDTLATLMNQLKEPVIQKNDQLNITVHSASLNQGQTDVFNVLNNSQTSSASAGAAILGYLVDFEGNINMPVLGKIKAEGLTKTELNKVLIQKLAPFIKDPVVNIRFLNFRVMVLGEVTNQGPQTFTNERATIVDAIGQAGGLTDMGKRTNIMVIRDGADGKKICDTLNLNDARVFGSPSYQLQQNDVVYVATNPIKLKSINTNPNIYRDIPFFLSLLSTFLLLANLFVK